MEYQSSTTLGSESTWNSYTGETEDQPDAGSGASLPNWRGGYESRPWLFLGLAFTAGCAAAALIPSSDSNYEEYSTDYSDSSSSTYARPKSSSYLSETWGKMQSAFIVAATRQAENFLEELVPGFREAYQEQGQSGDSTTRTSESL